jgi:hypothetical protein
MVAVVRTSLNVHGVTSVELTPVYRSLRNGGAKFQYITLTCADGSVLSITAHLEQKVEEQPREREAA